MRKLIITWLLSIITVISSSQGAEMISNGTFDSSSDWTITWGDWNISGGTANFLDVTGQPLDQAAGDMVTPIQANTEYMLTVYVSNCDRYPYSDQACFIVRNVSGQQYYTETYYREDKKHQIIFTTPASISDGGIGFMASNSGGTFSIDSVSLKPTDAIGSSPYYIHPEGNDAASGDITHPWRTLQRGFQVADAGDTVYLRDGRYYLEGRQMLDPVAGIGHAGTEGNEIVFMSYPGEWAILDGRYLCDWRTANNGNAIYNSAIYLWTAQWTTIRDLEVTNVFGCDNVHSYAIFAAKIFHIAMENLKVHQLGTNGFYIESGAWESHYDYGNTVEHSLFGYIDTLRFTNIDVYELMDTIAGPLEAGSNASAWWCSGYDGNVYIWEGCRSWNYGADGWTAAGGQGALRKFNNCWAMASYKFSWGAKYEGNGWKTGWNVEYHNDTVPTDHNLLEITNCLALFCGDYGFREGVNNTGYYYNNTVYWADQGFMSVNNTSELYPWRPIYRNNLAYNMRSFYGGIPEYPWLAYLLGTVPYTESHNTWDQTLYENLYMVVTDSVTVTDADFITTDSLTLVGLFTAARQADGSLPANKPLQLAATSDLINAGVDVGLTYVGDAPDIGYAEYGNEGTPETPSTALVSTGTPDHVNIRSGRGGGTVTSDGGATVTERGVCYSTSTNPTTANSKVSSGTGEGAFTLVITGLLTNTTYHMKAYAINSEGTSYGAEVDFTTPTKSVGVSGTTVMFSGGNLIILR
jgi:hypothetical protein